MFHVPHLEIQQSVQLVLDDGQRFDQLLRGHGAHHAIDPAHTGRTQLSIVVPRSRFGENPECVDAEIIVSFERRAVLRAAYPLFILVKSTATSL